MCSMLYFPRLIRSTGKYLDDLIAVSSSAEHRVEFSFPAVSVCGVIFPQKNFSILKPSDILRPWILWAKQHFAVKDSRGKKMYVIPEVLAGRIFGTWISMYPTTF